MDPGRKFPREMPRENGLDDVGVYLASDHLVAGKKQAAARIGREMPVRGAGVVRGNDDGASFELLYLRVGERVGTEEFAHRDRGNGSRRADKANAHPLALARPFDAGDGPFAFGGILPRAPQCQLHGEADAGRLGIRVECRVEIAHQLVRIRLQIGDPKVVDAAGQQEQLVLRRQQQLRLALGALDEMGDQDLVAGGQLRPQRRIVIAADITAGQIELGKPGFRADGIDEIESCGCYPGLRERIHRLRPIRRPERQRIVLVFQQGRVVHRDHRGMPGLAPHAGELMPVIVIDILDGQQHPGPIQAKGQQRRHQDDDDELRPPGGARQVFQ